MAIGMVRDFQKAFDIIDHDILWNKLYNNFIRGIALGWFNSNLSNRYQVV